MPLHLSKHERRDGVDRDGVDRDGVDRDALGRAALTLCRANRATEGVRNSRFYWVNPDVIGFITDADPGAFGAASGNTPSADAAKAFFGFSDLARPISIETWGEAAAGEEVYRLSQ